MTKTEGLRTASDVAYDLVRALERQAELIEQELATREKLLALPPTYGFSFQRNETRESVDSHQHREVRRLD